MGNVQLADHEHPAIRELAARLAGEGHVPLDKLERIFLYVRDQVKFGFLPAGDLVKASEVLRRGRGQCNNKLVLFLALCRAAGFKARTHFSAIARDIQRGIFPGPIFRRLPPLVSHGWLEVCLQGEWIMLDSFINDLEFFRAGKDKLRQRGWRVGYSIACGQGQASPHFDPRGEGFVQMEAVVDDHGLWRDPGEYFASPGYLNRPNAWRLLLYRLAVPLVNLRVARLRRQGRQCGPACPMC